MKLNISKRDQQVWNNAKNCNYLCTKKQRRWKNCENSHKLCAICHKTVSYGSHESIQPNSRYSWNIDHKIPKSKGGSDHINNLRITHPKCNREKSDQ